MWRLRDVTLATCTILSLTGVTVSSLLAKSGTVCASGEYHIGCSDDDATKVLNITSVTINLADEDGAKQCIGAIGCSIVIGPGNDVVATQAMTNLYDEIVANCNSKRECKGNIPGMEAIKWSPDDTHDDCGLLGVEEILSDVQIDGKCIEPEITNEPSSDDPSKESSSEEKSSEEASSEEKGSEKVSKQGDTDGNTSNEQTEEGNAAESKENSAGGFKPLTAYLYALVLLLTASIL